MRSMPFPRHATRIGFVLCLGACSSDPPSPPDPCAAAAVEWREFHATLGSNQADSERSQQDFIAACQAAPADLRECYAPSALLAEYDDCRRRIQLLNKDQRKYLFERLRDAGGKALDAEPPTD